MRAAMAAGGPARLTTGRPSSSGTVSPTPLLRPGYVTRVSGTLAGTLVRRVWVAGGRMSSSTSGKYAVVSADAHVLEPTDIWSTWLPKQYLDKAPKLAQDVDGGDAWLFAGAVDPDPIGLVTTPGMPWDQFRWTGVKYRDARPGCYDGAERLKDMAIDGVDAEVLFPPQRTIGHFLGDADDDFVRAGIEAYNNFLFDQFCASDPTRLVGLAQISSLGVRSA